MFKRIKVILLFILIACAGAFLISYRNGEFNVPVKARICYGGGCYGELRTYELYKDGSKYFLSARGKKYRITRDEYLRCLNKKEYTQYDDKKYEEGKYSDAEGFHGIAFRYKNILGKFVY